MTASNMGVTRIEQLRGRIDDLDRQIVGLLAQRTEIVRKLTEHKRNEEQVRSLDRVQAVLDRVRGLAERYGMPPDIAVATYRTLIQELTDMQMDRLAARQGTRSEADQ